MEPSIVAGPEVVEYSGAVSSTSWSKGCRSFGPIVWALLAPEGRIDPSWPVDFVV